MTKCGELENSAIRRWHSIIFHRKKMLNLNFRPLNMMMSCSFYSPVVNLFKSLFVLWKDLISSFYLICVEQTRLRTGSLKDLYGADRGQRHCSLTCRSIIPHSAVNMCHMNMQSPPLMAQLAAWRPERLRWRFSPEGGVRGLGVIYWPSSITTWNNASRFHALIKRFQDIWGSFIRHNSLCFS